MTGRRSARKMKRVRLNSKVRKAFRGRSRGFTMVEVVIAMLLLGIIGVAVLTSLSYASTVLIITDRRATAESLAKTQMEDVKSQNYDPAPNGGVANYTKITVTDIPEGYTIWSVNLDGVPDNGDHSDPIIAIPWDSGNNTDAYEDKGLQKITVIIKYEILRYDATTQKSIQVVQNYTLEDYKRNPIIGG
jgi:prepilin-type N-terminal cleavage/methylation domain-containing protein